MSKNRLGLILKKIDLFSTPISFKIENEYEYHSLIGGIFTIIFIFFTLFYLLYMGYFFVIRDNISFIYSRKIIEKEPYINLTEVQFNFAFELQYAHADEDVLIELNKYFDFSFRFIEWVGERNITYIPFNYKRCEKSDFFNKIDEQFEINRIEDLFCPDSNSSNFNFTINGAYVDDYFRYIEVKVLLSNYSLNNFKEFQNLMMTTRLEMVLFFIDKAIDYENRTQPLPFHFGFSYKGLDPNFKKETNIYISCIQFYNDDNWFFETPKLRNDAMYDQSVDTFIYLADRENNDSNLGIYNIEASSNIFVLNRKYEKLPSFFANLTGILNAVHLVFSIINEYINRTYINEYIIHKTMKYRGNRNFDVEEILNKFMDQELYENKKVVSKHNMKEHSKVNHKNNNKNKNNNSVNDNFTQFNLDSSNSIKNKIIDEELINMTNNLTPVKKDKNLPNPNINLNIDKKIHKKKSDNNIIINNGNFINDNINKKKYLSKTTTKQKDFSQMNILSIIYSLYCSCSSKKQKLRNHFFQQAAEKIDYFMDIRTYINRSFEHDLIVNLLFTDDEIHLFKFLSRPTIKVGENDIKLFQHPIQSEYLLHNYSTQKIDQLLQSYKTIYKKDKKPRLSKQLLEYMGEQIEFLS